MAINQLKNQFSFQKVISFFNFNNHAGLNFVHVNCRSIKKNFGPLNNFLNLFSSKLTAIAVTETWLTDSLSDVYSIPGYNFFSQSRIKKLGREVGLFVDKSINCKIRHDLFRMTDNLQCIFLDCQRPSMKPFAIGSLYRSPNSDIS